LTKGNIDGSFFAHEDLSKLRGLYVHHIHYIKLRDRVQISMIHHNWCLSTVLLKRNQAILAVHLYTIKIHS
jgi:hypothetical protein